MKAIIPVAGSGTKLRPHTYTQPKALMPLAGKTVLGIIINQLVDAGINAVTSIVPGGLGGSAIGNLGSAFNGIPNNVSNIFK
jgi:NDP-sugar pyrophosphorylase family protein